MLSVLTGGVAQSVRLNPRPGLKSELQPMTKLEPIRHHEENSGHNSFFTAIFTSHIPTGFMCGVTAFCAWWGGTDCSSGKATRAGAKH